jgi:AraC-like DNA-binding protein
MSPKRFAQIMQINWVVSLLYANDKAKLAQIAQDAGFYDQAHFNRAMQRFFRQGPRRFLESDHPGYRAFLAASRRFGPAPPDNGGD